MDWDLKDSRGDMLRASLNDVVFYILVTSYFTIWIFFFSFPFLFPLETPQRNISWHIFVKLSFEYRTAW